MTTIESPDKTALRAELKAVAVEIGADPDAYDVAQCDVLPETYQTAEVKTDATVTLSERDVVESSWPALVETVDDELASIRQDILVNAAAKRKRLGLPIARVLALLLSLPALAAQAAAQVPLTPGQQISFEIDPGKKQESPTSPNTIARPETNVAFEYRVDGGATPIPAVKAAPCTPVSATSAILTCRLVPPALSAGAHSLQVRSLTAPPEAGVAPSEYSTPPLSLSVIIVTPTGIPSNLRVTPPAP